MKYFSRARETALQKRRDETTGSSQNAQKTHLDPTISIPSPVGPQKIGRAGTWCPPGVVTTATMELAMPQSYPLSHRDPRSKAPA